MKRLVSLFLLALAFVASAGAAEKTLKFNVGKVEGISITETFTLMYEIHVKQGHSRTVEVVYDTELSDVLPDFESYLKVDHSSANSVLYLGLRQLPNKMDRLKLASKLKTIKVFVEMSNINQINLNGASTIIFDGKFKTEMINIDLSGASKFENVLFVNGIQMSVDCSGASLVSVEGDFDTAEFDASGASKINAKGNIKEMDCEFSGASKFTYEGINNTTDLECSGASIAEMRGIVNQFTVEASGACKIEAKDYQAKKSHVELSGASYAKIHATNELKHDVSKASKLTHYGDSKLIDLSQDGNVRAGTL